MTAGLRAFPRDLRQLRVLGDPRVLHDLRDPRALRTEPA